MPGSRLVGILLVVVFALSGAACGQPAPSTPAVIVVTATPAPAAPTTAPTTAPTAAPTAASASSILPASPTPAAAAKTSDNSIKPSEPTKPAAEPGGAVTGRQSGKSEV